MQVHDANLGEIFRRFDGNPIITANDFPGTVNAVFNPGATEFDGETLLLVRVENRTGLSSLVVATSKNGRTDWRIDPDRGLAPHADLVEEHWGVEDPRITRIGDDYYVVYVGYSAFGPLVSLAKTRDFVAWERCGVLQPPEDKDAALFPTTFEGRFALIHRPVPAMPGLGTHIWLSYSPDLTYWGEAHVLLAAQRGSLWDANKVGLGPPPLLTKDGWLLCYHAVRTTASGSIYRVGLALLERDDPSKVLARSNEWVMGPREPYELAGDVPGVVFPCGWILRDDGDTVHMYYGAADTSVCVAEGSVTEMLRHVEEHSGPLNTLGKPPSGIPGVA
jgi:predicted GH43/DUF377 family glycosyl hydrolase